jgi:hypothetical protein
MTAIGKIFVIINLLFSLVVAGFIVVLYAKSTNWAAAQKEWQKAQAVTDASRNAIAGEMEQQKIAYEGKLGDKDKEIAKLQGDVNAAKADSDERLKGQEAVKNTSNGEQLSMKALIAELEKRKEEVAGLEKQVKDKDESILNYITLKNQANEAKVAADIKANSYQAKAERLEARVRETEIEIVKLRRAGGSASGSGGVALVSTANPPPQSVEGIVTEVVGKDLVRISLGSDAGLEKGHTLDLFRLKPTPQYLGQIRLTDVRAAEAVGVPVDKLKYPVQKGDFVANDVISRK